MPRITIQSEVNLDVEGVKERVSQAVRLGLRDTIVAIHRDAVKMSPVLTGHNRRSIASEVSGMGTVETGDDAEPQKVVDDSKDEAACYSTSGYGGYLETGTVSMSARPYFRPALDMNIDDLALNVKSHLESEG